MNTSMEVIHHGVIIGRQWQGHECGTPAAEAHSLDREPKKRTNVFFLEVLDGGNEPTG